MNDSEIQKVLNANVCINFFFVFFREHVIHTVASVTGFEVIPIVLRNSASGLMVLQNPVEKLEFEIEIILLTQILTRMLLEGKKV